MFSGERLVCKVFSDERLGGKVFSDERLSCKGYLEVVQSGLKISESIFMF